MCSSRIISGVYAQKHPKDLLFFWWKSSFSFLSFHQNSEKTTRQYHWISVVNLNLTGKPLLARIVFVRSEKQKSQWLALLSTDLSLSEDEIVTLYGKRWDIEVFFKMVKSVLKLTREFQVRSYDALVSHTSIVFIRYIMLAVIARRNTDPRTFGELFYACYDEIQDITLMEALTLTP
jgi:hypothetical protein